MRDVGILARQMSIIWRREKAMLKGGMDECVLQRDFHSPHFHYSSMTFKWRKLECVVFFFCGEKEIE